MKNAGSSTDRNSMDERSTSTGASKSQTEKGFWTVEASASSTSPCFWESHSHLFYGKKSRRDNVEAGIVAMARQRPEIHGSEPPRKMKREIHLAYQRLGL